MRELITSVIIILFAYLYMFLIILIISYAIIREYNVSQTFINFYKSSALFQANCVHKINTNSYNYLNNKMYR